MRIKICVVLLLGWILTACSLLESQAPAVVEVPTSQTETEEIAVETQPEVSRDLPIRQGKLFSASGNCALCHNGMTDDAGVDISMGKLWRSTMMANAARDPYWQASVQHEVGINPEIGAAIEDKCATCHMPMSLKTIHAEGGQGAMFGDGFTDPEHPMHLLAMDGVSCTVCHQIMEDGLGTDVTFSGEFKFDTETEMGQRMIYGPFDVQDSLNEVMRSASGFNSQKTEHLAQASVCGSCHTLYTNFIDLRSGKLASDLFPEQTPFLEWSHSSYPGEKVCQDCHMPVAEGEVLISMVGGEPRPQFSQHKFVGGNIFMLNILQEYGDDLSVTATDAHFDEKSAQTYDQLYQNAAVVSVENLESTDGILRFDVLVETLTGHKFPSGFPSRRAWLHVTVTDTAGETVFDSGAWQGDGLILESDHDASTTEYEPHYDLITSGDQVQIYQPILHDSQGDVTTVLLHAAGYVKDNRLLPAGFDKATVGEDFSVRGGAADDDDFTGGGDRVSYEIEVGNVSEKINVDVELLYQTISYRWAMNLFDGEGELIDRFADYYQEISNTPVVIDSVHGEVGE